MLLTVRSALPPHPPLSSQVGRASQGRETGGSRPGFGVPQGTLVEGAGGPSEKPAKEKNSYPALLAFGSRKVSN